MSFRSLLASLLTLGLLAACGLVPAAPAAPSPLPATATATPVPATATPRAAPLVLHVWVPPRFDPASDAQLQARLDAFAEARPGLKIEVRVKDESTLLEAMRLTAQAAPAVSADLVILSRAELESASSRGLVVSLDASALDETNWYDSARALSRVRDTVYGLPFALDALVLVSSAPQPVTNWQDAANISLTFSAHEARFPLALYLSAGGDLTDADGNPTLDETMLAYVLALFAQGDVTAVDKDNPMPAQDGIAVGWASGYLRRGPPEVQLEPLPGLRDPSATLVDGWVWSVSSADVEKQKLAFDLALWLTAEEFVDEWAASIGYLPPHRTTDWDNVLTNARLVPPTPVLDALLPVLDQAVASVLSGTSPEAAAHTAVGQLK